MTNEHVSILGEISWTPLIKGVSQSENCFNTLLFNQVYKGTDEIRLSKLITEPSHSILTQSYDSRLRLVSSCSFSTLNDPLLQNKFTWKNTYVYILT